MLIIAAFIVLAVGLALKFAASTGIFDDFFQAEKRITWLEFLIGAVICCLFVVPFTVAAGNKWALSNNLTYHEFWSGYEVSANRSETQCGRDGSCQFTYDCDPYEVAVHHSATYDSKGKETSPAYTTYETHYHSCPEATKELSFSISTTLGDFFVERTFDSNPVLYRGNHGLRGNVRIGTPPFWQAAADRISAHNPGPVTVKKDYENYILASQSTILHKFSGELATYKSMLPKPASSFPIHDLYYADKAYFVETPSQPGWNDAVMKFNAAFGSDLQGDLHVLIVDSQKVTDADGFTGALNAYWTGPELGQDAISKNALVVVLGTDGSTVQWARAFTGMPKGNEGLLFDIQRELKGKPFNPGILGAPVGNIENGKFANLTHSDGVLEKQVWGVNQFRRVCMTCAQEGGGGFTYLGSEIQPTTGQKAAIYTVTGFLSLIVWIALVLIGSKYKEQDDKYDFFSGIRSRIERIGTFNRGNRW